ncbi:putative holin [Mycobacterium sp. Y57]|uniref:putative holin n=1 Tax=Mycolicibacterium xanthum TaxID=2796469 RepID=UPI001C851CF2|nr:putative holin [Mycolicibacterium xanthum]MBX7434824.1 putative holin [Mycolicibacterium xanthum]
MIPLPRASVLAAMMIVGVAVGMIAAIAATVEVTATVRPDVTIALVVGVPGAIGMLTILFSGRRWVTALGALILAIGPGWFGALAAIQVAAGV